MASRTYDVELKCGCLLSADGEGGLIPCAGGFGYYPDDHTPTVEEIEAEQRHYNAWREFVESGEEQEYNRQIQLRNDW